jgi:hypothetical protein
MRSTAYDLALWESAWNDFGGGLVNRLAGVRVNTWPPPEYRPRLRSAALDAYVDLPAHDRAVVLGHDIRSLHA